MTSATASVIVATLNEAANVDHVLDTALQCDSVVEVIIADGGSDDMTVAKIRARQVSDSRVHLVLNPDVDQSSGLNRAASAATADVLVRLDGHTRYAEDYVDASLGAWNPSTAVGGPMTAEGDTPWSAATAQAMRDPLAIGPARFHHADAVEDVDTVYLGTFSRTRFLAIGGYRTFPSGTVEDTDFYERWRSDGGTVVVNPAIRSWYRPRGTWSGLVLQYLRYGRGKAELIRLKGKLPSLRPLAPALLVAGAIGFAVVGIAWTWIPFALLLAAWILALAIVAVRAKTHRLRTAAAAGTMHLAYGIGLWGGLLAGRPSVTTQGLGPDA